MIDIPTIVDTGEETSVEHPSGAMLVSLLAELEAELSGVGIPLSQMLNAGRDPVDVRELFAGQGVTPPTELILLYAWHDGCRSSGYAAIPNFPFEGIASHSAQRV